MATVYDFDKVIDRTGTSCLKYDFGPERKGRTDLLPLWVADMDFTTPVEVTDAIKKRVEHGIFGYTDPKPEYHNAVSNWIYKQHGLKVLPEWNTITPGVVYALALTVKAYTNPGDYVLINQPVYYPFSEVIADNGRKILDSPLKYDNGKYTLDFEDIEKKIKDYNVKLYLFCNPHNPVGRVWTKEELAKLTDILVRNNVVVVEDAIHFDFVYSGHKYTPLLGVDERIKDQLVYCTSPSKTFNLAGLQVSNIFIPNESLRKAFKHENNAAGYSQGNVLGIVACQAAYEHGSVWYEELKAYLKGNLDFVRDYLLTNLPEIKLVEPEGTYLIWLDFSELNLCHVELEKLIVDDAKLWLDSGIIFGKASADFERINIACPRSILKQALDQLSDAVKKIR